MQTLHLKDQSSKLYLLADRRIRNRIDKMSSLNINIPSSKLTITGKEKHYVIATRDFHHMNAVRKVTNHEYPVVDILLSDVLNYCNYSSNNLVIVNNMSCMIDDKALNIETIIYDIDECSLFHKTILLK
jgi:archaellum biogenesis ATPase FlaH